MVGKVRRSGPCCQKDQEDDSRKNVGVKLARLLFCRTGQKGGGRAG